MIRLEVLGTPTPQGSKTRMPNGAMVEGRSKGQRDNHAAWRTAVADAARGAMRCPAASCPDCDEWGLLGRFAEVCTHPYAPTVPLDGPLRLDITFRFPMPASARKADRERGWAWKISAPDSDKLIRSVGDALKIGGLIVDDARFAVVNARKIATTSWTGAIITVDRIPDGAGWEGL